VITYRYSLVCLDCLVGLLLGKFVSFDEQKKPIPQQFVGYRDMDHNRWVGQPRREDSVSPSLWDAVQWFLFGHRDHFLAVCDAGSVLEMYQDCDPEADPFEYIDDPAKLLASFDEVHPGSATETLRRRVEARILQMAEAPDDRSGGDAGDTGATPQTT